jgi:hypothetical protein
MFHTFTNVYIKLVNSIDTLIQYKQLLNRNAV